jgi:hypothetical protein
MAALNARVSGLPDDHRPSVNALLTVGWLLGCAGLLTDGCDADVLRLHAIIEGWPAAFEAVSTAAQRAVHRWPPRGRPRGRPPDG